jgi:hypothetical protein
MRGTTADEWVRRQDTIVEGALLLAIDGHLADARRAAIAARALWFSRAICNIWIVELLDCPTVLERRITADIIAAARELPC